MLVSDGEEEAHGKIEMRSRLGVECSLLMGDDKSEDAPGDRVPWWQTAEREQIREWSGNSNSNSSTRRRRSVRGKEIEMLFLGKGQLWRRSAVAVKWNVTQ